MSLNAKDVPLLAEIDTLHGTLSGPATRKLRERAYTLFGDASYQRLARITNGHLYHPAPVQDLPTPPELGGQDPSGEGHYRRAAQAPHREPPGFLCVASAHQGELDDIKGLNLVNLVDEVTQLPKGVLPGSDFLALAYCTLAFERQVQQADIIETGNRVCSRATARRHVDEAPVTSFRSRVGQKLLKEQLLYVLETVAQYVRMGGVEGLRTIEQLRRQLRPEVGKFRGHSGQSRLIELQILDGTQQPAERVVPGECSLLRFGAPGADLHFFDPQVAEPQGIR